MKKLTKEQEKIIQESNMKAEKILENIEEDKIEAYKAISKRFRVSKVYDVATVLFTVGLTVIVFLLFSESLFEGFVSAFIGFISIRFLLKKRSKDMHSKFFGWL